MIESKYPLPPNSGQADALCNEYWVIHQARQDGTLPELPLKQILLRSAVAVTALVAMVSIDYGLNAAKDDRPAQPSSDISGTLGDR